MPSPAPVPAGAPPGGRRRRAAVDDYVGLRAEAAVEAARAVGLHPAPERAEAGEAGQVGLVINQEPAAGSPAPRDGVLTLWVADDGPRAEPEGAAELSDSDDAVATPASLEQADAVVVPVGAEPPPAGAYESDVDDFDRADVDALDGADIYEEGTDDPLFPEDHTELDPQEPSAPASRSRSRIVLAGAGLVLVLFVVLVASSRSPQRKQDVPTRSPAAVHTRDRSRAVHPTRRRGRAHPAPPREGAHRAARHRRSHAVRLAKRPQTRAPARPRFRASAPSVVQIHRPDPQRDEFF